MKSNPTPARDAEGRLLRPGHLVRIVVGRLQARGSLVLLLPAPQDPGLPVRVAVRLHSSPPRLLLIPARKITRLNW